MCPEEVQLPSEFYLDKGAWPLVFMQGDVLEDVPRIVLASPQNLPLGGTIEEPVVGDANYCRTRAIIITPTCNIRPGSPVQVASVRCAPEWGKNNSKYSDLLKGRDHKQFLLHDHPKYGQQIAQLTDVWTVECDHIKGLSRILCLADLGRHLLADALQRAFARPIRDLKYDISDYEDCVPAK
jgi:hypothetical protein